MARAVVSMAARGRSTRLARSQLPRNVPTSVAKQASRSKLCNKNKASSISLSDLATRSKPMTGPDPCGVPSAFTPFPLVCVSGARTGIASTRTCSPSTVVVYQSV
jgi:hypothetical protein